MKSKPKNAGETQKQISFLIMFGQVIRSFRQLKRMSQKELADKIEGKIDSSYIGRIERGQQNSSLQTIERILKALEITWSDVLENISFIERVPILDQNSSKFRLLGTIGSLSVPETEIYLELMKLYNRFVDLVVYENRQKERAEHFVGRLALDYIEDYKNDPAGRPDKTRVASRTGQERYDAYDADLPSSKRRQKPKPRNDKPRPS